MLKTRETFIDNRFKINYLAMLCRFAFSSHTLILSFLLRFSNYPKINEDDDTMRLI